MSETRRLFDERVRAAGGAKVVARRLGCSTAFVYELIAGTHGKRPGIDQARAIEDVLGVPMRSWSITGADSSGTQAT